MYIQGIVVAVLSFFGYCKGELQSFSIKYKTQITSNDTIIATVTVPSSIACARECTRDDCCTACYNKTTHTCHLHRDCFPVIVHTDSGVVLRKNDVETSNVTTDPGTSSDRTTLEQISNTGTPTTNHKTTYKALGDITTTTTTTIKTTVRDITNNLKTTGDELSTATTLESATENDTTAMIIDCSDIPGDSLGGVYDINVDNKKVQVYCEIIGNDQWTVIQKRVNGTTDFYRNWEDYKKGFGDVHLEYWIGNDNLYTILSSKNYKLQIDLEDWNGDTKYAEYDSFVVGNESTNYLLTISGYSGDAGDCLIEPPRGSNFQMNGMVFSTLDNDNDQHSAVNVAISKYSGWWFNWSTDANLNGKFYATEQSQNDAIYWEFWHATEVSLKSVSMKIKPN